MITRVEAYIQTIDVLLKKHANYLLIIEKSIQAAIVEGKTYIFLNTSDRDDIINIFNYYGYECDTFSYDFSVKISWK